MSRFNLQAKNLFFTWPQCSTNKVEVMTNMRHYFESYGIQFIVVCHEQHKDEGDHLHAVVSLQKQFKRRGTKLTQELDDLAGKHGNYKSCRSLVKSVRYVMKDGDYLSYTPGIKMSIEDWLQIKEKKKNPLHDTIAIKIMEGSSLEEIKEEYPGYFMQHKVKLTSFFNEQKDQREIEKMRETYKSFVLNEHQVEIIDHLEEQDDRKITWVFDVMGGTGKSTLAKYLMVLDPLNVIVFNNAKSNDISYLYNGQEIVIFDFTRTEAERINYAMIERIKNGLVFSGKYESTIKIYKSPKVACFSNQMPDLSAFSSDRWDIITV